MPMLNRDDDQLRFLSLYLGKGSKDIYSPVYEDIKKYGIGRFLKKAMLLFLISPDLFEDEEKTPE